jgi:hypothetical protein
VEPYGSSSDAGVSAYEIGPDFVRVQFRDDSTYVYTVRSAGARHIEQMKLLAAQGKGLTTYINQHVRSLYDRKER